MRVWKDDRIGGISPRLFLIREDPHLVRVPDQVRDCVVFIYALVPGEGYVPRGTAFLVSISHDEMRHFVYFVTAKHVTDGIARRGDGIAYLRVNTPNGGYEMMGTIASQWSFHPSEDEFVDVAVHPCVWDDEAVSWLMTEVKSFPIEGNCTKAPAVGVGDDLFITGLFVRHQGQRQSIPIVRIGNIAAMPGEPVTTRLGDMPAYLIEARSVGGLSGSPVFLHTGNRFFLLGLVHGHWDVDPSEQTFIDDGLSREVVNTGIAIVVPVEKIIETLDQPALREEREVAVSKERGNETPTMDSADERPRGISKTADLLSKLAQVPPEEADEVHRGH
jgi:hypothetical protein